MVAFPSQGLTREELWAMVSMEDKEAGKCPQPARTGFGALIPSPLSPHPRKISDSLVSEGLIQLQAQTGDCGKDRA